MRKEVADSAAILAKRIRERHGAFLAGDKNGPCGDHLRDRGKAKLQRLVAVKMDFSLAVDYRSSHIVDRPLSEEVKSAHRRKLLRVANQIGDAER